MAQKVVLISDLSGEELGDDGRTVTFGFCGAEYEIDLSEQEADQFAAGLDRYVSAARPIRGSGTPADPEQLRAMREWAQNHGYKGTRGRLPEAVQRAFHEANPAS